jgi:hypothetical protein
MGEICPHEAIMIQVSSKKYYKKDTLPKTTLQEGEYKCRFHFTLQQVELAIVCNLYIGPFGKKEKDNLKKNINFCYSAILGIRSGK